MARKRKNRRRRRNQAVLAAHCPPVTYHEMRRARAPELDLTASWFVAYTAVRSERRAEFRLLERGLLTFLPSVWVENHTRKVCAQRPLFPRYLFIGMDPGRPRFGAIRDVEEVERLLTGSTGAPLAVPARFMAGLCESQNKVHEASEPETISPGQMVRIIEGPFAGFHALVEKSTAFAADLATEWLGRKARLSLPLAQVEAI